MGHRNRIAFAGEAFVYLDAILNRIYAADDIETFPAAVLPVILELTASDCAGLCANALLPGDPFIAMAFAAKPQKITWQQFERRMYDDHATARFTSKPAPPRAIRSSDYFSSPAAFHATQHYQNNLRPLGMEHEMTLLMDTPLQQRLGLSVARAKKDYSDAEVEVLTRCGPHFQRAFHHAQLLAQVRATSAQSPTQTLAWRQVGITPRESEILRWIATGRTNREIAKLLDIHPATVKTHIENIFKKLEVKTRAAAVAALRNLSPPKIG